MQLKLYIMKKLIIVLICIPFLCFSQSTKTDKVLNDVNTATTVIGNVINIFKKDKNKDKSEPPKTNNENSASLSSDGTFSVNAKPEDIVAKLYKCTYKNLKAVNDEEEKFCVWKPELKDFSKAKQNLNEDEYEYLTKNVKTFATQIDTILTFKQKEIDNIVIVTHSADDDSYTYCQSCGYQGFIRFQTTDGKQMKLISNDKIVTESVSTAGQNATILQIDENNIFYNVPYYEGGAAGHTEHYDNIYSLDGKLLVNYQSSSDWSNFETGGYATSETEIKIDKVNKTIKLIESSGNYNKKGKLIKLTKETIGTYQYGNGNIIEIKQTTTAKPAAKKITKKK